MSAATHAKPRLARNLKPGYWVRSFNDDGSERWSEVIALMFTEVIATRKKLVHVYCTDCEIVAYRDDSALSCTRAEARRAGLVAA
jgi:hypothetical protein